MTLSLKKETTNEIEKKHTKPIEANKIFFFIPNTRVYCIVVENATKSQPRPYDN